MNIFESATLRLKQQLGVTRDKDVAEALGMSPRAWTGRKKNNSFPEVEVRALAQRRPDLVIDVDFVITGVPRSSLEIIQAVQEGTPYVKVGADVQAFLDRWEGCSAKDRQLLFELAGSLGEKQKGDAIPPDGRYPKRAESHPMALHETDPDRAAAAAAAKKSATKKR